MKKNDKNTVAPAPEKFWQPLVNVYFQFYKEHFRDEDGYALSPNWNDKIRGMESKGFKGIIITLRQIAEGKNNIWTEDYAKSKMYDFLKRAYNNTFLRKNFMCVMLNKYKVDILSSAYNPHLVTRILEVWYFEFPDYTRDVEKDKVAGEIIVGFLKQQYLIASLEFGENSVLSSVRLIFKTVKDDEFWCKKSLRSISNNLQEFVNRIKAKKNGNINSGRTKETPVASIKPKGGFGHL